jgi:hypothetical protein
MSLRVVLLLVLLPMYGCSSLAPVVENAEQQALVSPWAKMATQEESSVAPKPWQHYKFPGKSANQISYARQNGRHAMLVTAMSSASMLRQTLHVAPQDLASVKFSWKVPELIAQADMALRESDDSPVRIVLAFEGDRSKFSGKNAMLSELTQVLTGEPLPYATLMYVWCNKRVPGSVIVNPRTDRIRELVVESGVKNLNQWLDYERDIRADFEKAFGEMPGALVGIGIMTDTDNTRTSAQAWYGPLKLAAR